MSLVGGNLARACAAAGLLALLLAPRASGADDVALAELLRKARADGKYELLLRQIKVPRDAEQYADFHDLGYQTRGEYAGHTGLPPGHWVYVKPYWYIWRDLKAAPKPRRQWGPEQATGAPDAWPRAGDIVTAWASQTPDGRDEWLLLEYPEPVAARAVLAYATFNPGAVTRVTVFKLDGEEVEVWKGADPTPVGSGKGISIIPFRVNFKTNRVKLYLDSRDVGGWNEIDAVGLRAGGQTHWATAVEASTTYAQLSAPVPAPDPLDVRLMALEREVRGLKERLMKLEERIMKRKKQ